jgi:hypothetical protein
MDKLRAGKDANPPNNMNSALLFAVVFSCVAGLPILKFKGNLRRLAHDKGDNQFGVRKPVHLEEQ